MDSLRVRRNGMEYVAVYPPYTKKDLVVKGYVNVQ
jgi:hypothetical protein